mmetsp:Transcript_65608/g.211679  ORF Transcript_65608/g.211679 Transcript_65608/m.211679 type:complete len:405 (+) Transcript_65608:1386-2600(+)
MGATCGEPGKVPQERGQQLAVLGTIVLLAKAFLHGLAKLLDLLRRGPRHAEHREVAVHAPQRVQTALQHILAAPAAHRAKACHAGHCPEAVLRVEVLAQTSTAVARGRREASVGSRTSLAVLTGAARLPPGRRVAKDGVEQHRVHVLRGLEVAEAEAGGAEGVQRLRGPGDGRQHGRHVPADADGPRERSRAVLLQRPGALLDHLRVLAVRTHGGKHGPHAAAAAAVPQRLLLPREVEERPVPHALQLDVGPVAGHGLHDRAHAAVLVGQEAGAEPGDDEDAAGEELRPLPVAAHDELEDAEGFWGHAVVVEELPQRRQRAAALELDPRVLGEEAHHFEQVLHALEGPSLVHAPAERDNARAVDGHLPRANEDPLQHLAPVQLDLLVSLEIAQCREEAWGLLLF